MIGHQRWGWKKTIISLLAGAILLGVAQPATANDDELEKYFSLPDITCSELYNPPGGQLTFQDAGFRWTHCACDTPDGVVVYGWFLPTLKRYAFQSNSWSFEGDTPDPFWRIFYTE